eukprot:5904907-Prymnesium_polylepis.2
MRRSIGSLSSIVARVRWRRKSWMRRMAVKTASHCEAPRKFHAPVDVSTYSPATGPSRSKKLQP